MKKPEKMTEDTSSKDLRKLLESDNNEEISEGLSILKEQKNPALYQYLFAIAYWNPDEELAETAKSIIENELGKCPSLALDIILSILILRSLFVTIIFI